MNDHRRADPIHSCAGLRLWIDQQCLMAELRADREDLEVSSVDPNGLGLMMLALVLARLPARVRSELGLSHIERLIDHYLGDRGFYPALRRAEELLRALLGHWPR